MDPLSRIQPFPKENRPPLAPAFLLAGLGQYFLIQQDQPWTVWPGCAFFTAAAFWISRTLGAEAKGSAASPPFSRRIELVLFFLILGLAAFFRLYRLGEFPAGLFNDQSNECLDVLRILRTGWRPSFSELFQQPVCVPSVYGYLCLWFKLLPAGQLTFFLSSVVMSLAAFPFLYWSFRRLSGPAAGLLAVFFIAVLRWHVTYSRDGHPAVEIPFYTGLTLALWLYAVESRKAWAFALTGAGLAATLYSYQVGKAFVFLMVLYAAFEWLRDPGKRKGLAGRLALLYATFGALGLPIWREMAARGSLGWREDQLMAFPGLYVREGAMGVWRHFQGTLFSFNRTGDGWFYHNIPGHRLLDDATGTLLVLALFHAVPRIKERVYFYPAAGFSVMCLPAFLSVDAIHASRLFGTIPFIALLCGNFLSLILQRVRALPALPRNAGRFCLSALLAFCLLQNFRDYFWVQALRDDCWRNGNGAEASWIGKNLAMDGDRYTYLICPRFYGHYTVRFLGYPHRDDMVQLRLPESMDLRSLPRDKGVCLALEEGETGVLQLFRDLYPGGALQELRTPSGTTVAALYRLTREQVQKIPRGPLLPPAGSGLDGTYFPSLDWNTGPVLLHRDPLINFTFRNDFPIDRFPPLSVWWTGRLEVPLAGSYRFLLLTTDQARLKIGDKTVLASANQESEDLALKRGEERINLFFQKAKGVDAALSLLWKKPGDPKYEVVPYSAFRRDPPLNR